MFSVVGYFHESRCILEIPQGESKYHGLIQVDNNKSYFFSQISDVSNL